MTTGRTMFRLVAEWFGRVQSSHSAMLERVAPYEKVFG